MELIRKTKTTITKNGNKVKWGEFLCPYCLQKVEKDLSYGKIQQSCGCIHNKDKNNSNYKHGLSKTRLYNIWRGLLIRCLNCNSINYKDYGGRSITICPEWTDKENGFINFRNWALDNGYKENLQIDREKTNGNYEPSNCHFVTPAKNNQNKRNNVITMEIANEIRELHATSKYVWKELAEKYNVHVMTISRIINNKIWINKEKDRF